MEAARTKLRPCLATCSLRPTGHRGGEGSGDLMATADGLTGSIQRWRPQRRQGLAPISPAASLLNVHSNLKPTATAPASPSGISDRSWRRPTAAPISPPPKPSRSQSITQPNIARLLPPSPTGRFLVSSPCTGSHALRTSAALAETHHGSTAHGSPASWSLDDRHWDCLSHRQRRRSSRQPQ